LLEANMLGDGKDMASAKHRDQTGKCR
jgi:hypothetical protein